jgi:hypothetical protein
MSRYDFAIDEEKLGNVASDMKSKADEVRTKIEEIYNIIDNTLAQSWRSSAYDDFKAGCHKYEMGLYELANMIEIFGITCDTLGGDAEALMDEIKTKF